MILADKIIEERKKNGWSQEELAEKLGVSRQSVSKWESAQSVPDLNRILNMSKIFGVSTDYLLKDEIDTVQKNSESIAVEVDSKNIRNVSMEEAVDFLKISEENSMWSALSIFLYTASPIVLLILSGLAESKLFGVSEDMIISVGVPVLLFMVALGVYISISCGNRAKKYKFISRNEIETAYGVAGLVREKKNNHSNKYTNTIAIGVVACILACVPLLVSTALTNEGYIIFNMVALLNFIIAISVNRMVQVGLVKDSYDKLLQEGDFTVANKKIATVINKVSSVYWAIALAIYLAWSLYTMDWEFTWIVWPVAGVSYTVVINITKIFIKAED
ncbi:helix-turn-helix domain-containing protein [Peptoniphilus asaccharolyticus]